MPDPKRPDSSEADISKTVTLSEKDVREAARLFRLLADSNLLPNTLPAIFPPVAKSGTDAADRQSLVSRARVVLNSRRIRKQYFNRDLFGEPAWEILLALFITEESAGRLSMGKLAEWIEVPLSTVVRWVKTLEEEGLIERTDHPTDRRTVFIRLREKGKKALDAYLGLLPG
jgi:DNA-binding MarR family transcriptional regulator